MKQYSNTFANKQSNFSLHLLVTLMTLLCLLDTSQGVYQVDNAVDCGTCIGDGQVSCRPTFYDRYSFCCDEDEVGTRGCGGSEVFCSGTSDGGAALNPFACPYASRYCGAGASELEMHPENRNALAIEIENRLFQDQSLCYYQVFVNDQNLDEANNAYYWDITFENLLNVEVAISNGTSFESAGDTVTVGFSSGYRFQYEAPRNQIWMSFTGSVNFSTSDPRFKVSIRLRTFPLTVIEDPAEIVIREIEVEIEEVFIEPKRKEQKALDILLIVTGAGAFVGILANCCCGRKASKEPAKKKKVQQTGDFREI